MTHTHDHGEYSRIGSYLQVVTGYLIWGSLTIFWKSLDHVPSLEVLVHRIIWCTVWLSLYIVLFQHAAPWRILRRLWKQQGIGVYIASALIVGINWLAYVYAVQSGHILQASLGYYICPIIIVLIGVFFFRERMNRLQKLALLFCSIGVLFMTVRAGTFPWLSILIAATFAGYGTIKKMLAGNAVHTLLSDTVLLSPFGIAWMMILQFQGASHFTFAASAGTKDMPMRFASSFQPGMMTSIMLIGAGLATFVPLVLFIGGTVHIPYKAVGFMQFITPTMTFLIGVFLYREQFSTDDLIAFICIWAGVLSYIFSVVHDEKKTRKEKKTRNDLKTRNEMKADTEQETRNIK